MSKESAHRHLSFFKSVMRIVGLVFIALPPDPREKGWLAAGFALLILAEIIGIFEETV